MRVDNRAALAEHELTPLQALALNWPTLQEVVRWALAQTPALLVSEVVVQDEFTHDVVLPCRSETYLVFDTT